MKDKTPLWEASRKKLKITNSYILSAFGEFWGTFILGLFAIGAGCQASIICNGESECGMLFSFFPIPMFGEVLGLMIAITIFGGASGAHINPAVTLGLAVSGKIGWAKVPLYWTMQFFGAYLGGLLAYGLYSDKLMISDRLDKVSMFAPPPQENVGIAFADQVVGTAILVMIIHAALDERNMRVPKFFYGFLFALTIAGINFTFRLNAGGVLNPARDIGGRLIALTVGAESEYVFQYGLKEYWLAPMFGPLVGGVVGALMYVLFVGAHLDGDTEGGNGNPSAQQQGRPDWRSTEFVKRGGQPPNQYGAPPPPPPQKEKKKKKKGGFGFGNLSKLGDVANLADGGMDLAQNFEDFDPSALENLENMKDMVETARDARDFARDARDLAKDGYGAYQDYNNARQPPPPPQQRPVTQQTPRGYGAPPPNSYGPPGGAPPRQSYGGRPGNYY